MATINNTSNARTGKAARASKTPARNVIRALWLKGDRAALAVPAKSHEMIIFSLADYCKPAPQGPLAVELTRAGKAAPDHRVVENMGATTPPAVVKMMMERTPKSGRCYLLKHLIRTEVFDYVNILMALRFDDARSYAEAIPLVANSGCSADFSSAFVARVVTHVPVFHRAEGGTALVASGLSKNAKRYGMPAIYDAVSDAIVGELATADGSDIPSAHVYAFLQCAAEFHDVAIITAARNRGAVPDRTILRAAVATAAPDAVVDALVAGMSTSEVLRAMV